MLRGLITILILANLLALGAIRGLFGPASGFDSKPLSRQIHPENLGVRPIKPSESVDVPIVGGPVVDPAIQATTLTQ